MDRRKGCRRNGESVGHACYNDYPLGFWKEAVPTARLPIHFMLCHNNRVEDLCVMQPRIYFTEEYRESGVILWCGLVVGILTFQVAVRPLVEPACHAISHLQQEQCRLNLRCFECYCMKKRKDIVVIGYNFVRSVACRCVFR